MGQLWDNTNKKLAQTTTNKKKPKPHKRPILLFSLIVIISSL